MFDPIGELNARSVLRPEPNIAVNERELQNQQEQKIRESRQIEKSDDNSGVKKDKSEQENQETARYKQEDDRIIYEKYNKNGELIFRIPPKQKPLNELA